MSSRLSNRTAISALVLAVLFALAAPPAHAAQGPSLLDHLGSKVQSWLASWLPGVRVDGEGVGEQDNSARPRAAYAPGQSGLRPRHGQFHRGIKALCDTGSTGEPNGCPPN